MKFFIFFAALIAACSASGYGYGYGVPVVTKAVVAAPVVHAAPAVTSVTSRLDTYGAKVVAAPVLVGHGGYYGHGGYGGYGYNGLVGHGLYGSGYYGNHGGYLGGYGHGYY